MANKKPGSKKHLSPEDGVVHCREQVVVRGARTNNLKNIDIDIPRDKFVVITGLSGSGKSSLAFDTIYAEGNRRYMEGLSSYARNFLDIAAKPDVDKIENLSPSISIDQKSVSRSPRSTVGTMTEVYDYLRVLFARIGRPHCPYCGKVMDRRNNREILSEINVLPTNTQVAILAAPSHHAEGSQNALEAMRYIQQKGFARAYCDGRVMLTNDALLSVGDNPEQKVAAVVDRVSTVSGKNDEERILDSIETAMKIGGGSMFIIVDGGEKREYNQDFICNECKVRIREINPRHFSFNNPEGACTECSGAGVVSKINPDLVIPNKNLSLAEGAIQPWSKSERRLDGDGSYFGILKNLSKVFRFSVDLPVRRLTAEQLAVILYGSKRATGNADLAEKVGGGFVFEGVIPELERKYRETKSDYLRSEIERYMISYTCPSCQGKKLRREYLAVQMAGQSIDSLVNMDITELKNFFVSFARHELRESEQQVFDPLAKEIIKHLESLENVGLEYLNLARGANSISGGEAQRIRLAVQINSQLMGILYVLDEPSIGLHSRDTEKLVKTIRTLQAAGNSLVVVEHDEKIMRSADWIVDMGPGAGYDGGQVVFQGTFDQLMKSKTCTADYLAGRRKIFQKRSFRRGNGKFIEVIGATENNLKNIDVKLPLGKFVAICGVSGSGKSTLVSDILSRALARHFFGAKAEPGKHRKIKGLEHIDKVISIDQSPIGRTPRSNAATYTGAFSHIRDIFAEMEESKNRGYTASRFSFNMKGGRCEVCQGEGQKKIEMHLLPDVYVACEACEGTGYNKKTLEIEYKGFNIAQVLEMDVSFALRFFAKHPLIAEKLKTMEEVGLGYLKLGQSATNLSGGEAQRIKLSTELARKSTGRTLYILDEPTIGLHFDDVSRLLHVLDTLVEKGNSVLVVEHNLDVVKSADWVVELGPDGGNKGGEIVYEGTPDRLKNCKLSWTAKYL